METCFVIQRIDGAVYDKRYAEIFAPAIEKAGLVPIRADEVLGTNPIIEKIIDKLSKSLIVFAEISEDNANIFLELGFALALGIPTIMVCDRTKRTSLPFDVSHRPVIFYSNESLSDFESLKKSISDNVVAAAAESRQRQQTSVESRTEDIQPNDFDSIMQMCLLECLEADLRSPDGTPIYNIQRNLVGNTISDRMVNLAVMKLIDENMLESAASYDEDSRQPYNALKLTDVGRRHILRSYSILKRTEEDRLIHLASSPKRPTIKKPVFVVDDLDDDVPF